MTLAPSIALERIMPPRLGSVDPSAFPNEEFDLYSIPAFDKGEPEVLKGRAIGSAKQIVQPGDVLLSRIVPHIRRAWVVGRGRGRRIIASGEWIVFRGEDVDPRYLRHVLVSDPFHAEFMRTVSGVGGSLLRARPAYVAKIKVPLPALPEQRRIAEVLNKADALRAKRRAALDQLDTLTQSIFLDMFGDPATNYRQWVSCTLGDALIAIRNGVDAEQRTEPPGWPITRIETISNGTVDLGRVRWIEPNETLLSEYQLEPGDILFSHINSVEHIGKTALYEGQARPLIHGINLLRLRPKPNAVDPVWLLHLLKNEAVRAFFRMRCKRAVNQASLNQQDIKSLAIALPPLGLQKRFTHQVHMIDQLRASLHTSLQELITLFACLQHRAFNGEL